MLNEASTSHRSWADRLSELKACSWYWGDLPWRTAERLLMKCDDGSFLVRDSRSENHLFTVSYRHLDKIYHSRVEICGQFVHLGGPLSLQRSGSVVELLQSVVQTSMSDVRHILMHRRGTEAETSEIHLKYPLSRFSLLPRLQYLCRLCIRKRCHQCDIENLPLPSPLIAYVSDPKYLIPDIDQCVTLLESRMSHLDLN
uniref:Suppressor of cytokine signaling 7 n=1 Tax=Heterorhabditis bacteriophora TaxID=37862 RepID=A0A1I7X1L7_HETBA